MDDMVSKLSGLLGNPDSAEKIKQIAESFTGSGGSSSPSSEGSSGAAVGGIDSSLANSALSMLGGGSNNRDLMLLNAIKPYMRQSRAQKIDTAIRCIKIIEVLSKLK